MPAPGPRVPPPLGGAGGEGVSHVQTFPGAEPSLRLSDRSPRPPPARPPSPLQPRLPRAAKPPGPPRVAGWQRPGPSPRAERGLGRGRTASAREAGTQAFPARTAPPPPPPAMGFRLPGPSQRRGPSREIPHGVSVCAGVCVCVCAREVVPRPEAPGGSQAAATRAAAATSGGGGELARGAHQRDPATLGPSGQVADRAALPSSLASGSGNNVPSTEKGQGRRPHVQRERRLGLTLGGPGAGGGVVGCTDALGAGQPAEGTLGHPSY